MINLIIFSKDRAMQLECLLRSVKKNCDHFDNIYVIYWCSDESYREGYKLIKGAALVEEVYLKQNVLYLMDEEYVCFMVDDQICFKEVKCIPELKKKQVFSMRLGNNVRGHHNYPLSVDAHVYRTQDIKPLMESIKFDNPNKLETYLQRFKKGWEILYEDQCFISIPHNRVSEGSHCFTTNRYPPSLLNERFLKGERIDFESMNFSDIGDVHKDIDYKFKTI